MLILAIDPGSEQSAYVFYDTFVGKAISFEIMPNDALLKKLGSLISEVEHLAIEMIACYGMPVGASVFETCVWIGRFIEAAAIPHTKVYRKDVKMFLCGSTRAKDSNIRQAIMDKYGSSREKAIGTKKSPGPLHGFKADIWAAMGVALTWDHTREGT